MPRCSLFVALFAAVLLVACQPAVEVVEVTRLVGDGAAVEVTRLVERVTVEVVEVTVESAPPPALATPTAPPAPGLAERPAALIIPPSVPASVVTARSGPLVELLARESGVTYEVVAAATHAEAISALCAAPERSIAILPALLFLLAERACGAQAALALVNPFSELPWQAGMFVVPAAGGDAGLDQLVGQRWGIAVEGDLETYLYPLAMLGAAGVEPGEIVTFGSDTSAILALLNGEVDFVTAAFVPPLLPDGGGLWRYGQDDPEVWRALPLTPTRHPRGYIEIGGGPDSGGYRIRDARAAVFDSAADVFSQTRVVTVTAPLPADAIVYGPEFPLALARRLTPALMTFASSEACALSLCSSDYYGASGLQPIDNAAYAPLHLMMNELALSEDEILALLGGGA
jgi:ABC-type phosphate/phosphonate transport system substrate-binding protein